MRCILVCNRIFILRHIIWRQPNKREQSRLKSDEKSRSDVGRAALGYIRLNLITHGIKCVPTKLSITQPVINNNSTNM